MMPIRRLGIAFAILLTVVLLVVAERVWLSADNEKARFLGQPCREANEEVISSTTLLAPPPQPGAETPDPLPAPPRALAAEPVISGPEAVLAKRYEPILNVAKVDRFWPVSVPTILNLELGERFTRFVSRRGESDHAQLSDLRRNGGAKQYLDYPAVLDHVEDEFCSLGHALHIPALDLARWRYEPDLLEPARSAQFYFLERRVGQRGIDLQYWFFYPLNYLPELTNDFTFLGDPISSIVANVDFHEGDFEHVTVRLRPKGVGLVPKTVEMARHKGEDRPIPWDSPDLQLLGDHPVVYAGFGGHASYEKCGPHVRHALGFILLVDWTLCGEGQNFVFGTETPLVDLRSVRWPCWPGHFGELPPHPVFELLVEGPRSPYFQQDDEGKRRQRLLRELCPPH
jgi:hypothetical protein